MLNTTVRIDSHLHVWDRAVSDYSWLKPEHGSLYASWSPELAKVELARCGFSGAVLVQAEDSQRDTRYLLEVANNHPWVLGVVGWVQLDDPAIASRDLAEFSRSPAFCGVRHLVNDDVRADFLDREPVRASLVKLAQRGFPFEIHDAWPRHLDQAERLARDLPQLTLVIDHLALPPRDRDDYGAWERSLARVARLPNTVAKVSGLGRPNTPFTTDALRKTWNTALDLFGSNRLMYGGNWPLTIPTGGYQAEWRVVSALIGELERHEQVNIMSGTAQRVYDLKYTAN